jgi:hydroxyacylglutathione hydrolase
MKKSSRLPIKELIWSWVFALILLLISSGMALLVNHYRSNGIELFRRAPFDLYTDCPEVMGDLPSITMDKLPVGDKKVVYMDSRSAKDFVKGHIPNALFMPMYPIDIPDLSALKTMVKGTWIVVYGSKEFQSDERLVTAMMNQQIRGVYILKGGLSAWRAAKRPVKTMKLKFITLDEALNTSPLFIDARDDELFEKTHIKGAIHLPFEEDLPPEVDILKKIRLTKKSVIVYDSGEITPNMPTPAQGVANELNARGISNVMVLTGGYSLYKKNIGKGDK